MSESRKVFFVYEDTDGDLAQESLWAKPVVDGYEIENIPFFAKNIAFGDVIEVEEENGVLYFNGMVRESGWSTLHVAVLKKELASDVIKMLESAGLDWEGYGKDNLYLAVGIPPHLKYSEVTGLIDRSEAQGIIDYGESCISRHHRT